MPPKRQLNLPMPRPHGGRRRGAGRPNRSGLRAHTRRPILDPTVPVHVSIKIKGGMPSIRKKTAFRLFRHAVSRARRKGFTVAHFSIQSNHAHFIIEPRQESLARQFQSLCISFAKQMNRACARKGAVFHDRYFLRELKTPTEVRRALIYVLTNEARHRGERPPYRIPIDPFSSALAFDGWARLLGRDARIEYTHWHEGWIREWFERWLREPRTWLLRVGWLRAR